MNYPKRNQYKYSKSPYRIRNWPEYEAGLRLRGDLTIWFSNDAINSWRARPSGKPGGQRTYANIAIEAALSIRMVFHLPLRQTEGFLHSLANMLEVEIPIPDHTTGLVDASGTSGRATASAAWSRTRSIDTRRSSADE